MVNIEPTKLILLAAGIIFAIYLYMIYQKQDKVQNHGDLEITDKSDKDSYEHHMGEITDEQCAPEPGAPTTLLGAGFEGLDADSLRKSCFRKELDATDLLPMTDNVAEWADVNPDGSGLLQDKNFLHAGHHIGINTVGQSLRNPNYSLRSEPPNPQVVVSPWVNSSIAPDLTRRHMEIGSCE